MNEVTNTYLNKYQREQLHIYISELLNDEGTEVYVEVGIEVMDDIPGMEGIQDEDRVNMLEQLYTELTKTL